MTLLRNGSNLWTDLKLNVEDSIIVSFWIIDLFAAIIGSFGNILVICVISFEKSLWTSANFLLLQLAFFDLLICSLSQFTTLAGALWDGKELFKLFSWNSVCQMFGLVCNFCCLASPAALVVISFNRWLCISKSHLYPTFFGRTGFCHLYNN